MQVEENGYLFIEMLLALIILSASMSVIFHQRLQRGKILIFDNKLQQEIKKQNQFLQSLSTKENCSSLNVSDKKKIKNCGSNKHPIYLIEG